MKYELGIIGAGKMAEAIARGVIANKLLTPEQIIAADVSAQRRSLFQDQLHVHAVEDNLAAGRDSRVVLLSVKPQQMADALAGLGTVLSERTLVISIAAGITTRFIESNLGTDTNWRVIRSMPNTPMMLGEGMVAIAAGTNAMYEDLVQARKLFEVAADVVEVPEEQIDAVTAVSGSGPAYFFFLVEQMTAAGIELGLSPENADILARKTALGAARMLMGTSDSPQQLRKNVTSPGGTTQAAIEHMEKNNWPAITRAALHAAAERGKELGR